MERIQTRFVTKMLIEKQWLFVQKKMFVQKRLCVRKRLLTRRKSERIDFEKEEKKDIQENKEDL